MWRTHGWVLGLMILAIVPLFFLDRVLLGPKVGQLPLDLRGLIVKPYMLWLLIQAVVSTAMLYGWRGASLPIVHGSAALLSLALLAAGWKAVNHIDNSRDRAKREAREATEAALQATLRLERWWFEPDAAAPKAIHMFVATEHSGRFASSVTGVTEGEFGLQLFSGELRPQRWVEAGEMIEVVMPLTHHSGGALQLLRFRMYLFPDGRGHVRGRQGSAPQSISVQQDQLPDDAQPE